MKKKTKTRSFFRSVMQNFNQLKSLCNVIYFLSEHMVFIEFENNVVRALETHASFFLSS